MPSCRATRATATFCLFAALLLGSSPASLRADDCEIELAPAPLSSDSSRYFTSRDDDVAGKPSRSCFKRWLEWVEERCTKIERECREAEAVLRTVFGVRRHELPDFIISLETDDDRIISTAPRLIWREKNTPYVYGADHAWVLVFSDTDQVKLEIEVVTLFEKTRNPFSGLLQALKISPGPDPARPSRVETAKIALERFPFVEPDDEEELYLGIGRVPVAAESVNLLRLTGKAPSSSTTRLLSKLPDSEAELVLRFPEERGGEGGASAKEETSPPRPDFFVSAHFSNSRASVVGFGLGLVSTLDVEGTSLGDMGREERLDAYALAKAYFIRPRMKAFQPEGKVSRRLRPSLALVVGTEVDSPFDEVLVGLGVGHLFGRTGLIVGANLTPAAEGLEQEWLPFVGFDYSF